jgi:uncharacterized coiled-coil protein SlyX
MKEDSNNNSNKSGSVVGWPDPWGQPPQMPSNTKSMTPTERVQMIESLYEEVLGRKPDNRDINFYKYSTLSEEDIRKELTKGKEHKGLIANGREFKRLSSQVDEYSSKIKMLEMKIKDQEESFVHMNTLLSEKNKYIEMLRDQLKNPFEKKIQPMPTQVHPVIQESKKPMSSWEKLVNKIWG